MADESWRPGDPLYAKPAFFTTSGGHPVLPMFSIIEPMDDSVYIDCTACLVGWSLNGGDICWNCGKPSEYRLMLREMARIRPLGADLTASGGRMGPLYTFNI